MAGRYSSPPQGASTVHREARELEELLYSLSLYQQTYFYIKAWCRMNWGTGWGIALAVTGIGIVAWIATANVAAALVLVLAGVAIGILLVWESERRK